MTREDILMEIYDSRITSLGKLPHGYVVYHDTAKKVTNQIFDYFEARIAELEADIIKR